MKGVDCAALKNTVIWRDKVKVAQRVRELQGISRRVYADLPDGCSVPSGTWPRFFWQGLHSGLSAAPRSLGLSMGVAHLPHRPSSGSSREPPPRTIRSALLGSGECWY